MKIVTSWVMLSLFFFQSFSSKKSSEESIKFKYREYCSALEEQFHITLNKNCSAADKFKAKIFSKNFLKNLKAIPSLFLMNKREQISIAESYDRKFGYLITHKKTSRFSETELQIIQNVFTVENIFLKFMEIFLCQPTFSLTLGNENISDMDFFGNPKKNVVDFFKMIEDILYNPLLDLDFSPMEEEGADFYKNFYKHIFLREKKIFDLLKNNISSEDYRYLTSFFLYHDSGILKDIAFNIYNRIDELESIKVIKTFEEEVEKNKNAKEKISEDLNRDYHEHCHQSYLMVKIIFLKLFPAVLKINPKRIKIQNISRHQIANVNIFNIKEKQSLFDNIDKVYNNLNYASLEEKKDLIENLVYLRQKTFQQQERLLDNLIFFYSFLKSKKVSLKEEYEKDFKILEFYCKKRALLPFLIAFLEEKELSEQFCTLINCCSYNTFLRTVYQNILYSYNGDGCLKDFVYKLFPKIEHLYRLLFKNQQEDFILKPKMSDLENPLEYIEDLLEQEEKEEKEKQYEIEKAIRLTRNNEEKKLIKKKDDLTKNLNKKLLEEFKKEDDNRLEEKKRKLKKKMEEKKSTTNIETNKKNKTRKKK